jgi:hypothetical protein
LYAVSAVLSARIRSFLKRFVCATILSAASVILIAYGVDYGVFRSRMAENKAFGQVAVTNYDAVQQKSGKTVFLFEPPQAQTCVNSLFPRAGYVPCWYLRRHSEQRTDI